MGLEDIMLSEVSQAEVSGVNSQSWIKRSSAAVLRLHNGLFARMVGRETAQRSAFKSSLSNPPPGIHCRPSPGLAHDVDSGS